MVNSTKALLQEALALPDPERADLATALLASLDEPSHDDLTEVSKLWREELEKRANGVLLNDAGGEDWDKLRQRLTAELGG